MPTSNDLRCDPSVGDAARGLRIKLLSHHPKRLDEFVTGVIVTNGHADLFACRILPDGMNGVRRHIARCVDGDIVLPVQASETLRIILVGGLDAELEILPETPVAMACTVPGSLLIERWMSNFGAAIFGASNGRADVQPNEEGIYEIAAGETISATNGVRWIELLTGRLTYEAISMDVEPGSPPVAVIGGLTLTAKERSKFIWSDTVALIETGALAQGLEQFHGAALSTLAETDARNQLTAKTRLSAREKVNQEGMADALDMLARVVGAREIFRHASTGVSALAAAVQLACAALGVEVEVERLLMPSPSVDALARMAGVGHRAVMLRANWWREDNGPLVGHRYETLAPLVMLPDARGRYRLIDPATGASCGIDAAVAATIGPSAHMLYAPLPNTVRRALPLIRFGLRGSAPDFWRVAAAGLGASMVLGLVPVVTGLLFGAVIPVADRAQIGIIVFGLVAGALGATAFDLSQGIALLRIEARMEARLQPALMQRLLSLPVEFFRGFSTGDLHDRVLAVPRFRRLIAGSAISSVLGVFVALTSLAVILSQSAVLALMAFALTVLALAITAFLARLQIAPLRKAASLGGLETALTVQMLQGILKLRTTASEPRLFAVWAELFARKKSAELRTRAWTTGRSVLIASYPIIALMLLFLSVASRLDGGQGGLSFAAFVTVNAAFGQLLIAVAAMIGAVTSLMEAIPLFERAGPILATPPETRNDGLDPGPLDGRVELSHVSFRYEPNAPMVIDDLSLRIEPGSFVAIVGASGSGKSTLLRLLLGFDRPESGDIFYQNLSIGSIDPTALRRRIGVVLQNGRTMAGNVFENITNGLPYSLDQAWEAARMAGLAGDIEALPMGMHTQLMEGAPALSGGQIQRLMIARALVGHPDVLMFDEATSALDNRTQAIVTSSLSKLGATRIVIAHRLSTVERADRIVVLDHGRIVEEGRFDELMRRDGPFRALASRQQL